MPDIFKLDAGNPTPFQQPFLVLYFTNGVTWYVDVAGQINLYLKDYTKIRDAFLAFTYEERIVRKIPGMPCNVIGEASDWRSQATPLFQDMLDRLAESGLRPKRVYGYQGSGGATHILRYGALFKRVDELNPPSPVNRDSEPNLDVAQYLPLLFEK